MTSARSLLCADTQR